MTGQELKEIMEQAKVSRTTIYRRISVLTKRGKEVTKDNIVNYNSKSGRPSKIEVIK